MTKQYTHKETCEAIGRFGTIGFGFDVREAMEELKSEGEGHSRTFEYDGLVWDVTANGRDCYDVTTTHELDNAKVGDGVTYTVYTDRHAGTIIKRTAKTITMQFDKAELLNGMNSDEEDKLQFTPGGFVGHTSGVQRYSYERNPNGETAKFSRREWFNKYDNRTYVRWVKVGANTHSHGSYLTNGRNEHYDYNF